MAGLLVNLYMKMEKTQEKQIRRGEKKTYFGHRWVHTGVELAGLEQEVCDKPTFHMPRNTISASA